MLEGLSQLQVVHRCPCGCASISFTVPEDSNQKLLRVADAEGFTSQGESVGFLVQATAMQVAHVEVYWHHTAGAPLPVLGSLRPNGASNT
jgi:hypothetical protein